MKIVRPLVVIALLLLPACLPKRPDIPGIKVPAGPLVQALEQQRSSFAGLKAVANVEVVRGSRKRTFDTVGIVLDSQRRLRVEAVGPLGQSLVTLVWDGKDVLLRLTDDRIIRPGLEGIGKILGMGMDPKELCAVLSGRTPESVRLADVQAFCVPDGVCAIEAAEGKDIVRRVYVLSSVTGSQAVRITAQELYRSDRLVYRARYERIEEASRILLPRTIIIENPEKEVSITISYVETDVNVPVSDDAFTIEQ